MKLQQLWRTFSFWLFDKRWCIKIIMGVTAAGTLYGFYWYRWQLAETPVWLSPFVPDCPLASFYFLVICMFRLRAVRLHTLEQLAVFSAIKYGIWTVGVLLAQYIRGGALTANQLMLLISHIGLLGLGLVYWPQLNWSSRGITAAVLWHAANDAMDYGVGVHPYLPEAVSLSFATWLAVGTTVILSGMMLYAAKDFLPFVPNKRYTVSSILEEKQEDV